LRTENICSVYKLLFKGHKTLQSNLKVNITEKDTRSPTQMRLC